MPRRKLAATLAPPQETAPPTSGAKSFSIPSPPRISDLRRKYGIVISAAGHSPTYSSTPSPSPPPARPSRAIDPVAKPGPAAAPAPAPQTATAPVIKSKRPPAATRESLFPVLTTPAVAAIKEEEVPAKSSGARQMPEAPALKLAQPPAQQQMTQARLALKAGNAAALQLKMPAQVNSFILIYIVPAVLEIQIITSTS